MRSTLLVLAITVAGCGSDGAGPSLPDLSATPDLARVCATTCDVCASGTVCVTRGSGPGTFDATCLPPCQTRSDCSAPGSECLEIAGSVPSGRYCVTPVSPPACSGQGCSFGDDCSCVGDTLACPGGGGGVCGLAYEGCPKGCTTDPSVDGGLHDAHCR